MDGVLIVNKPNGITSHDVVSIVRKLLQTKKVGHVGTLDPIADGVLVVCINHGTKIASFLESDDKIYECTVRLGISTDTFDITGNTIEERKDFIIDNDKIDQILASFLGKMEQVPPIYSAIKVNGKKLYQYAREGKEVELKPRSIEIFSIRRCSELFEEDQYLHFKFIVHVSKGTYIRSIVNDLGIRLNIPCTMSRLTRVKSGNFSIENSYTINDIKEGKYHLINLVDSLSLEKINVKNNQELITKIQNGMKLGLKVFEEKKNIFAFIIDDKLLAIYEYNDEKFPCYKPVRVWSD